MDREQQTLVTSPHGTVEAALRAAGEQADPALDIARVALLFARADQPERPLAPYEAHLDELVSAARSGLTRFNARGAASADMVAGVLADCLAGRFAYRGDSETYDDLKNADLMHVIDRRMGLPVSLGILYLHVGAGLGLDLVGLNFPSHFLLRLQIGTDATIIDPFNGGETLSTADLLNLLRSIEGPDARLVPDVYAPVSVRDILLRQQNNILSRALRAGDHERARAVVTRMIWLAPTRAGLRFELGRLEVHVGHMAAAASAFETCRAMASDEGEMRIAGMAEEALRRLQTKLN
jgi:regulator of sirC expression with transglutaminase-like and TPR domain